MFITNLINSIQKGSRFSGEYSVEYTSQVFENTFKFHFYKEKMILHLIRDIQINTIYLINHVFKTFLKNFRKKNKFITRIIEYTKYNSFPYKYRKNLYIRTKTGNDTSTSVFFGKQSSVSLDNITSHTLHHPHSFYFPIRSTIVLLTYY